MGIKIGVVGAEEVFGSEMGLKRLRLTEVLLD